MLHAQRLLPLALALLAACGGGEDTPSAVHPAPAYALANHVEGLAADAGEVVLAADLSGFDGVTAPDGWTLFQRPDRRTAAGEDVVSLVRAVETLQGDIDFHTVVTAGPVALRLARLPAELGPIPGAAPGSEAMRAYLLSGATRGDAREVQVAVGSEGPQDAWLLEDAERLEELSSRILVAMDLVVGQSAVGVVELRRRPSFEVQYQSAVYGAPSFTDEPVRGRVNLGGDHRMALVVPEGRSIVADLDGDPHLTERTRIELALGALSGVDPAELVDLSGRLELLVDDEVTLSEPFRLSPGSTEADRRWREVRLDLAGVHGLDGTAAVRLRLSVDRTTATDTERSQPPAVAMAHPRLVGGTSTRTRHNLILISLDTLRGDRVGPGPDGRSLTPNLDAFAARALDFTEAESVAPFTLPSHGTVFTGLLPSVHGGVDVQLPMRAGASTLTELIALAGWTTTAFTGGGFMSPDFGFARGFERYTIHDPLITTETLPPLEELGLDLSNVSALVREDWENYLRLEAAWRLKRPAVESWFDERGDEPFFLFLHTYAAHQYHPPRSIYDEDLAESPSTWTFGRKLPSLSPEAFRANPPSAADQEHLRLLYDACVRHADEEFGAVMAHLAESGLLEDSYVVVFSDHGEELFEQGDFGHSNSLRESLLRVPLMISGPGVPIGAVDEPVSLVDLAPTLCTLLGLPIDPAFQGRTLLEPTGLVAGKPTFATTSEFSPVFSEVSHHAYHRDSLRLDKWKVVRDYGPEGRGSGATPVERLFDLTSEEGEASDLAAEQPDLLGRLIERLDARRSAIDAAAAGLPEDRTGVSDATKDQLGDLGYL